MKARLNNNEVPSSNRHEANDFEGTPHPAA